MSQPFMRRRRRDEARKKILIVEDVEFNRDLVQLLEDDYEIITAANGEEGIQLDESLLSAKLAKFLGQGKAVFSRNGPALRRAY